MSDNFNTDMDLDFLEEAPESPEYLSDLEGGDGEFAMPEQKTPHVMYCDEWAEYRGRELIKSTGVRKMLENHGAKKSDTRQQYTRSADAISALWDYDPEMVPEPLCTDKEFHSFMTEMMESDDFQKLRRRTVLNNALSEIAAAQTLQQYYALVQKQEKQKQDQANGGKGHPDPDQQRKDAASQAASQGLKAADEAQDMIDALGCGSEAGAGGQLDPDMINELYHQYKNNRELQDILQAAGQYLAVAKSMQKNVFSDEPEEVNDITVSGTIEHMLPSEIAMLCDERTRPAMIKRIIEKQALAFKYESEAGRQAGPIMVFCDESGSMSGERITQAKAISLVMAWIAIHQNRWCHLAGFADRGSIHSVTLDPSEPVQDRTKKTLSWLGHFYSGGTDVRFLKYAAIEKRFVNSGAPRGETDILLISDADVDYKYLSDEFNQWKRENQVRLISIGIDCRQKPFKEISDHSYTCDMLNPNIEGVQEAFKAGHRPQENVDDLVTV